jgi:hypothetical protein
MLNYRKLLLISTFAFLFINTIYAQTKVPASSGYPRTGERYITDSEDGIIKMWVNVWGQVNSPGSYLVYDGIDLASLLSVTGGPKQGANLKRIKLYRDLQDENGKLSYTIDLEKFLKTGNRDEFTRILPNDTFVVPQSSMSYIVSNLNIVNTLINFYNLYTIAKLREEQAKYYSDN